MAELKLITSCTASRSMMPRTPRAASHFVDLEQARIARFPGSCCFCLWQKVCREVVQWPSKQRSMLQHAKRSFGPEPFRKSLTLTGTYVESSGKAGRLFDPFCTSLALFDASGSAALQNVSTLGFSLTSTAAHDKDMQVAHQPHKFYAVCKLHAELV